MEERGYERGVERGKYLESLFHHPSPQHSPDLLGFFKGINIYAPTAVVDGHTLTGQASAAGIAIILIY